MYEAIILTTSAITYECASLSAPDYFQTIKNIYIYTHFIPHLLFVSKLIYGKYLKIYSLF